MAILRASSGGLLRAAAGRRAAPPGRSVLAATAATTPRLHVRGVKDDLGGPGGQEPPPEKPSGTDAIRRNWVPLGGAALLLVGAYAYLTGGPTKPTGVPVIPPETETAVGVGVGKDASPGAEQHAVAKLAKKLEDKESESLAQLSGRKKSEFGPFRSE
ncbi:hypothetical protein VFPFJ_08330 [Purpureocillium lilacinum]|nr:hypothetical protein VFPFJ_08330 [Purpureocillium lilacinum]OAQ77052.1 hypothetical protein VFPBJ_07524 [Purpureocillium lilacinum]OAQ85941.1 hypothetical protein VFPFJ_08330 [Purpureocillium lilacinum]GJN75676.1 hypothetical protein PLICBS_009781 [Purpureocillium lilacinum]